MAAGWTSDPILTARGAVSGWLQTVEICHRMSIGGHMAVIDCLRELSSCGVPKCRLPRRACGATDQNCVRFPLGLCL